MAVSQRPSGFNRSASGLSCFEPFIVISRYRVRGVGFQPTCRLPHWFKVLVARCPLRSSKGLRIQRSKTRGKPVALFCFAIRRRPCYTRIAHINLLPVKPASPSALQVAEMDVMPHALSGGNLPLVLGSVDGMSNALLPATKEHHELAWIGLPDFSRGGLNSLGHSSKGFCLVWDRGRAMPTFTSR